MQDFLPVPPVADADRIYTIAPGGQPVSSIDVPFPIYGDASDLVVKVDTFELDPSKWRLASKSGNPVSTMAQPIVDGQVQFTPAISVQKISVIGQIRPRQLIMPSAPGIGRREFNQENGMIVSALREAFTRINNTPAGPPGPKGPQGIQGQTGDQGPEGLQGSPGPKGDMGHAGERGPQGVQGVQGPAGNMIRSVLLSVKNRTPADLPANGIIPKDWDYVGNPVDAIILEKDDAVYFSSSKDVYSYVTTSIIASGWNNLGEIVGPQGIQGYEGPSGPPGSDGVQGDIGPQGPRGAEGPRGAQGEQGDPGVPCKVAGEFYNRLPVELPASGLIPKDWDGPGQPPRNIQLSTNDGLIYNGAAAADKTGHLYLFVGSFGEEVDGWVDAGRIVGPAGPAGPEGVQGARGPQGDEGPIGPQGEAGRDGPEGPQGIEGAIGPEGPAGKFTNLRGEFVNKTPDQLPANGYIPKDFDGPNDPPFDVQLSPRDSLLYNGTAVPAKTGHLYIFTGDPGLEFDGWIDGGVIVGPQGPRGPEGPRGATGDDGPEGPRGAQGDEGPIGPQGPEGPFNPYALDKRNNLSDLEDVGIARQVLGLGNAASANIGFGAGEVAPGDQVPHRDGTGASGNWNINAETATNANHAGTADSATNAGRASNSDQVASRVPGGSAGNLPILDVNGKIDAGDDKYIISASDPDPAQGSQNWLWFKV